MNAVPATGSFSVLSQTWQCIRSAVITIRRDYRRGWELIDAYYDAGGWYHDGNGGDKDYYNPFVMLTYGIVYAMFMSRKIQSVVSDIENVQWNSEKTIFTGLQKTELLLPMGAP